MPVLGQMLPQLFLLLEEVGGQAVVDVVEEGQHGRHLVLFAAVERLSHCLPHRFSLLLLAHCPFVADRVQELGQSLDRIVDLPILPPLLVGPVKRRIVRGRVISNSVGHEFKEIRSSILDDIIPGESSSLKHCERIVAVDPAAGDPVGDGLGDDSVGRVLVLEAGGDGVLVVSEQEERLALERSSEVEGSWEIALARSALAQIASCYLLLLCHSESVS